LLIDKKNNTSINISEGTVYRFTTHIKDTASTSPNRLSIITKQLRQENTITSTLSASETPQVSVYPNPNDGSFTVNSKSVSSFQVYSLEGVLLLHGKLQEGNNVINSHLTSGLYVLKVGLQHIKWLVK
jgi:hypothetical protein